MSWNKGLKGESSILICSRELISPKVYFTAFVKLCLHRSLVYNNLLAAPIANGFVNSVVTGISVCLGFVLHPHFQQFKYHIRKLEMLANLLRVGLILHV